MFHRWIRAAARAWLCAVAGSFGLFQTSTLHAGTYSNAVLADSPLAYWRLGEASSAAAAVNAGSLGAAANGTYTPGSTLGAASLIRSDLGNTAYFVSGANRMTTPSVEKFAGGTGYTAEYWVNLNSLPTSCCVNTLGDGEGGGDFYFMNYVLGPAQGTAGTVRPHFGQTGNTVSLNSTSQLQANKPAHVVTTWSQSTGIANIYINGKLINSANVGTNLAGATSNNPFFIGQDNRGVDGSNMVMDEVAFYNKPLSLAQVQQHYTLGRQTSSISLSTDVMIGDTTLTGPGQLGDGFNNNAGRSTIELVRFIGNSDSSPLNIAYSQDPSKTIDFSPYVVSGATAGNMGANVHGRGSALFMPGDGETIVNNNGGIGFGGHGNKLITFDLTDIEFEHFGNRDTEFLLTGRFGMNGQGGVGEVVPSGGQVQGLIFLDGVLIDSSPLQDILDASHFFQLRLPGNGRFLTFAIVNGDNSSFFDDGVFRDVTLTAIPEPASMVIWMAMLAGLPALVWYRRRAM